uniref:CCHC-type domain-containing protein n=1 Tax=Globodera rostochiensis TaxID=31243 RepID=A0A914HTX5_GLORO
MDKMLADILQQLTNLMKQQHSTPTEPSGTCNVPLPDIQPFNNEDESVDFEDGWIASTHPPSVNTSARVDEITTFGFEETKKRLKKVFACQHSLAIDRYDCLRAGRVDGKEFGIFINRLKNHFRKFRYSEMNEDQFKCLVLLTALKAPSEAKLRQYVLSRLTAEETKTSKTPKLFDVVSEELQTTENRGRRPQSSGRKFRAANYGPQVSGRKFRAASFWAAKFEPQASHHQRSHSKQGQAVVLQKGKLPSVNNGIVKKDKAPPNNCYCCGDRHWAQNCPKINWTCRKCSRKGHTEQMCDKIQSFRQNKKNQNQNPKMNMILLPAARINSVHSSNLLRASIRVNSGKIEFILDTSADIT